MHLTLRRFNLSLVPARQGHSGWDCDPLERGVRIDLAVLDELDRGETVRIQDPGELPDRGRLAVDPIRLLVAPHEEVDEARRMLRLLPDLVAQRAWLVRPHVRYELVDCGQALIE